MKSLTQYHQLPRARQDQGARGTGDHATAKTSLDHLGYSGDPGLKKMRELQKSIDGVADTMRENVTKVLERGEKIDSLEMRSQELLLTATRFEKQSRRARRKMWLKKWKTAFTIATVIVVVAAIVLLPILL